MQIYNDQTSGDGPFVSCTASGFMATDKHNLPRGSPQDAQVHNRAGEQGRWVVWTGDGQVSLNFAVLGF